MRALTGIDQDDEGIFRDFERATFEGQNPPINYSIALTMLRDLRLAVRSGLYYRPGVGWRWGGESIDSTVRRGAMRGMMHRCFPSVTRKRIKQAIKLLEDAYLMEHEESIWKHIVDHMDEGEKMRATGEVVG